MTTTLTPTEFAAGFAHAIAAGDRPALQAMLSPTVAFRALTPGRAWEFDVAGDAIDTIVGTWFGGERHIDSVEAVDADEVGDVVRLGYRFRATTPAGPAVVEQQAYLAIAGDTITSIRLVCSGYRPL